MMATVEKCPWCGSEVDGSCDVPTFYCGANASPPYMRGINCRSRRERQLIARVELLEKTVIALLEAREEIRADGIARAALNANAREALGQQS